MLFMHRLYERLLYIFLISSHVHAYVLDEYYCDDKSPCPSAIAKGEPGVYG